MLSSLNRLRRAIGPVVFLAREKRKSTSLYRAISKRPQREVLRFLATANLISMQELLLEMTRSSELE